MLAAVRSTVVVGVEALPVQIEVDVSRGLPQFAVVGLPDVAVRESRDRVRAAIRNSGFEFPPHRIIVNLSPAKLQKAGTSFDLAIALGLLAASGQVPAPSLSDTLVLGELSLDGGINPVRGVLAAAIAARHVRIGRVLVPAANASSARIAYLRLRGVAIKLIEPQSPGPLRDFLDSLGNRAHHLGFDVGAAFSQVLARLTSLGGRILLGRPDLGYTLVDFSEQMGLVIELTGAPARG
jgi:hypothetical protein